MSKFKHSFLLTGATDSTRMYGCGKNTVRLDFVSGSCLRVALYRKEDTLLPTFSVCPDGAMPAIGREKLDTAGFAMCAPQCTAEEGIEHFLMPCGIRIELNTDNFLLSYRQGDRLLFADRAPLAYNFGGEFGKEQYHYIAGFQGISHSQHSP